MTTDNKTLADVQPGGRVRLGDQAERARFEEWAISRGWSIQRWADGLQRYCSCNTERMWEAFQAGLSAQPSPGGQGDTQHVLVNAAHLERVLVCAEGNHFDDCMADRTTTITRAIEQMREALAARQPVSETDAYQQGFRDGQDRTCTVVARQPVGEPVAEIFAAFRPDGSLAGTAFTAEAAGYWSGCKVVRYTAPPAKAVDLDAVRALLERRIAQWRSHLPADPGAPGTREIQAKGEHDYNNDVRIYREGIAVMAEVLHLIDSQGAR